MLFIQNENIPRYGEISHTSAAQNGVANGNESGWSKYREFQS